MKKYQKELDALIEVKESTVDEMTKLKESIVKKFPNEENENVVKEIDAEINRINNLVSMIENNLDDETQLNKSLIFFFEEYEGRIEFIRDMVEEHLGQIKIKHSE